MRGKSGISDGKSKRETERNVKKKSRMTVKKRSRELRWK